MELAALGRRRVSELRNIERRLLNLLADVEKIDTVILDVTPYQIIRVKKPVLGLKLNFKL
jgi:hypothetical protein